ncbi:hypothetical protein [Emcibacter sp.]|uniref:hypothetical protein n=1 Tax=Emcibacter sp. TaxID=1979954 RepID=UPI002AA61B3D|nr:hypothetical protein [Emcibacter sp.]
MKKNIVLTGICLATLFATPALAANCVKPEAPDLPEAYISGADQLIDMVKKFRNEYQPANEAYKKCLLDSIATYAHKSAIENKLAFATTTEIKAAKKLNAAIREFNEQSDS